MSNGLLSQQAIVVEQVRKFFELRQQYGLFSTEGQKIGQIEQIEQSPLQFLVRLFSDLDVMLPTTLAIEEADGTHVLRLHKPWFRWTVEVSRPDGTQVGTISKKMRLGKARFSLTGPDGRELGAVHAQNWRARDFEILDANGQVMANVNKKWRGLLTEAFTDADTYVVDLGASQEPLRSLALAAALSIDVIMKQKDR
ncbi:MAG: phospholipid scramblase-related protein [Nitriliruptorales bacterium]|nr:phospholipid scramblase-related protein [Nitriliruptorales bacterium]